MKKFTFILFLFSTFILSQNTLLKKQNSIIQENHSGNSTERNSFTVPRQISYQGLITKPDGSPTDNGSYEIFFKIYDSADGGNIWWSENQEVSVNSGIISTTLGNVNPITSIPEQAYLELTVDGSVLSPRQVLTSVFYSILSDTSSYAYKADYNNLINKPNLDIYVMKDSLAVPADDITIGDSDVTIMTSNGDVKITPAVGQSVIIDSTISIEANLIGHVNDSDLMLLSENSLEIRGELSAALISGDAVLDEDDMASDSETHLATQQSIKAYIDTKQDADESLQTISALEQSDGNFIVSNGSDWTVEKDSVARASLGLGDIAVQQKII